MMSYPRLKGLYTRVDEVESLVDGSPWEAAITDAIGSEVTARNSAISTAISEEVTSRNTAIGTAISSEVTNRNTAIDTAVDPVRAINCGTSTSGKRYVNTDGSTDWTTPTGQSADLANTSYAKIWTFTLGTMPTNASLKIRFGIQNDSYCTIYGRIYRNGTAVGTERSRQGSVQYHEEIISGWNTGDAVELWGRVSTNSGLNYLSAFSIRGTVVSGHTNMANS